MRLIGSEIAFGAGRVGIDGQPNDTFASVLSLQLLHVVAAVMLFHERAFRIKPLEHDVFAFVLRERLRLAIGVRSREIGRGAADRRNVRSVKRAGGKCGDCGEDQFGFHKLS